MNLDHPVSAIMTANPITIDVGADLHQVKKLMTKHKIRHLPILREGAITGMVSKTDLNRLSFGTVYDGHDEADAAVFDILTIEQIMASKVVAVQQDQSIRDVAGILASHEFHALPVLDGDQVVGIVTTTDLIRLMLQAS
jgi:predicted transcriptional regulator